MKSKGLLLDDSNLSQVLYVTISVISSQIYKLSNYVYTAKGINNLILLIIIITIY